MGDFARMTLTGVGALKDRLAQMQDDLRERALRSAGFAGANVICAQAIANAPEYTGEVSQKHPPPGTLKKSIIVKRIEELCGPYRQTYYVTVRRGDVGGVDGYYAHWVEYGHFARGPWQPIKGGRRSKVTQRAALEASGAKFVPAQPFMRTAFEMTKSEATRAIERQLAAYLSLSAK